MDNGKWTMENGQCTARLEETLDTSRMENELCRCQRVHPALECKGKSP